MQLQAALIKNLYGYYLTQCISVVSKIKIADHLSSGGRDIDDLAKLTGTNGKKLYRVMRLLVANNIFSEDQGKSFRNNSLSWFLRTDVEGSLNSFCQLPSTPLFWQSVGQLEANLKSDTLSGTELAFDEKLFPYLEKQGDTSNVFKEAMSDLSRADVSSIKSHYSFENFETIGDVGGGDGALLESLVRKNPKCSGILFDQDHVIQKYKGFAGISPISGNFFESVPFQADLYILRHILHDWNDDQCLQILTNIRKTMAPTSKILVIELLLQERGQPNIAQYRDFTMLALTSGFERTFNEYSVIAEAAGLTCKYVGKLPTEMCLIEMELKT